MNKNWFKKGPLPFVVLTKPSKKKVTNIFNDFVSDEELKLILSSKGVSMYAIVFVITGILFSLIMTVGAIFSDSVDFDLNLLIANSSCFGIAFLFWLYSFILPTKTLTLQRFTGVMTYPSYGFYPHFTTTFTRAKVYDILSAGPDGTSSGTKLMARNPYNDGVGKGNYTLALSDSEEWWSFFVWYMDKNRPLPPGKGFDEYRAKDFERRKAAGFPKPLFESNIPTPEATKQQQKERLLIGGW